MKAQNVGDFTSLTPQSIQNNIEKVKDDEFQKKLKSAIDSKDETKLKEVSKDIETIFINMMMQQMRKTIVKSNLTERAPGSEIYESMFDEKIAEEASKGKGFGLADMIYKQLYNEMKNKYKIEE